MTRLLSILILLAIPAISCGNNDQTVTVMIPSSMTDLASDIDLEWGGPPIKWIIAGSRSLLRQLEDGAKAEVLITADAETMAIANDRGIIETPLGIVATNRLVFAIPMDNPGRVKDINSLGEANLLIGICAAEVPCGRLASRAEALLDIDIHPDTEEPNVRALALKIKQGELDGGLVYATDAQEFALRTVDDAALAELTNEYSAASVNGASSELVTFFRSDAGRRILTDRGFNLP